MKSNVRHFMLVATTVLLGMASPLRADAIEERAVLSGKVKPEADKGYIYLHGADRFFGVFLRVPDEAARALYQEDQDKALAKAQKRYPQQLKSWQIQAEEARLSAAKLPPRPKEPTPETFSIDPIELRDLATFGPMFVYRKSDARVDYFNAVKPGTYVWYGPVAGNAQVGFSGTCYCMGTVSFEVKPGVVTDLGNFLHTAPQGTRTHDVQTMEAWRAAEARALKAGQAAAAVTMARLHLAFGLPESLKGWETVRAEFRASGKIDNFLGLGVSRLAPIDGVLSYRRDTVVDLRTNIDVSSPPMVSPARARR